MLKVILLTLTCKLAKNADKLYNDNSKHFQRMQEYKIDARLNCLNTNVIDIFENPDIL